MLHEGPHVLTWELTRTCSLHCRHCRAQASREHDPKELTLSEVENVLDDLAQYEWPPIVVFTGGDPLERPDLPEILAAAHERGLRTAVAPSVTPLLTEGVLEDWKASGVSSVALSLDGATPRIHDGFRGARGTFQRTIDIARAVTQAGLRLQINTSVSPFTRNDIPALGEMVQAMRATSWELFFVIPTGRARVQEALGAQAIEEVLLWLADFASHQNFRVTVVGAPQYQRVRERVWGTPLSGPSLREGRGFAFIDHYGAVYPSGYLPLEAGSVRSAPFSTIYATSTLFQALRDPHLLKGACGQCPWSRTCGGSRARAFAITGDMFQQDPGCWQGSAGLAS